MALAVVLAGCTGGSGGEPLSGIWSGSWSSDASGSEGTFELSLEQDGNVLEGTIAIDGTACLSGGVIRGSMTGSEVRLSVVQREVELDFTGTRSGRTISGAYTSSCDGGPGRWEAERTG